MRLPIHSRSPRRPDPSECGIDRSAGEAGVRTCLLARATLEKIVPWAACAVFLLWVPFLLPASHSPDDAEPEILNGAYRLSRGLPLYHGVEGPPWVITPYPPLYSALVAAGLRVTGLSYRPARLVSLLSSGALGLALVTLSRRWHGSSRPGLWAACLLVLVPAVLYNCGRPHPQMLAVTLSVWSYVFLESPGILSGLVSPLFAVLALYTKQTQIALPLAASLFMVLRQRARLVPYILALTLFAVPPLVCLEALTHGAFLDSIGRLALLPYDFTQLLTVPIEHMGIFFLFTGLAATRLLARFRAGAVEVLDVYLAVLALVTLLTLGRVGAHSQYVLELLVLVAVYLVKHGGLYPRPGGEGRTRLQLAALLVYAPLFVLVQEGPFDRSSFESAPVMRALLASASGPIVSQQGSFSLFTRGEIHVQLFHFMGLARMGVWDEAPLLREVEEHRVAWVVTESPLEGPLQGNPARERFSPELWEALGRNYERRAHYGPYYVYGPAPLRKAGSP
jgi:hypothetical protein